MNALLPSPKGFSISRCASGSVERSARLCERKRFSNCLGSDSAPQLAHLIPSTSVFRPSSFALCLPSSPCTNPVATTVFIDPTSSTSGPSVSMYCNAAALCGIVTAAPPNEGERRRSRTDGSEKEAVSCSLYS